MSGSVVGTTIRQRWRTARWVVLALIVITLVGALSVYLTAPRDGGRMDADATSADGARALVSLLRDYGVDVTVADSLEDVEKAATADSLVVIAQTFYLVDDEQLQRLAALPADLLLVEPVAKTREALAPEVSVAGTATFGAQPDCDMREANRAGEVQLGASDTYEVTAEVPVTSCYEGAVVRYTDDRRTVTVVGTADFMTNSGLLKQGNAALAMNLAGTRPHVVWYAPQREEAGFEGTATLSDLIPDRAIWIVWQLVLAVLLFAIWKGRRLGPLVAERLPVVVRASETVEGRGRLYRSHRARDRAADALRTATLQRLLPRLGLAPNAQPPAVAQAVAERAGRDPAAVGHILFGPPPATDSDLVNLAHELDNIERQVAQS
ncbi:DUF4350 domain-containing protein [Mycobacterium hubeiense]|uniref:DUF4350 domain-containing protein n=1 Tax=Mycobacterium hubeiense TaxID=1867256 RepID=UPI000C7EC45B|nr:DUF4350 domain-containing protein [Mycobacterium sp. QGD 101]